MNPLLYATLGSGAFWWWADKVYPWPTGNHLLQFVSLGFPRTYLGLWLGYEAMLFTIPFIAIASAVAWVEVRMPHSERKEAKPNGHAIGLDRPSVALGTDGLGSPIVLSAEGAVLGIIAVGAKASGKTTALKDWAEQLVSFKAQDPEQKTCGLIMEVKGTFTDDCREIFKRCKREDDLIVINMATEHTYNPLDFPHIDSFTLASGVTSIIENIYGKSHDGFWDRSSTDIMDSIIRIVRMSRGYVTFQDVYRGLLEPQFLAQEMARVEGKYFGDKRIVISESTWKTFRALKPQFDAAPDLELEGKKGWYTAPYSESLMYLIRHPSRSHFQYTVLQGKQAAGMTKERAEQFACDAAWVREWYHMEKEFRQKMAITARGFLKPFQSVPELSSTFCPPLDGIQGRPRFQGFDWAIEHGKYVLINFPRNASPVIAKTISVLAKLAFESAIQNRIAGIKANPKKTHRYAAMLIDEYQDVATSGDRMPVGDASFFNTGCRDGLCIPVLAIQGISSLDAAVGENARKVIMQGLVNNVVLRLNDNESAKFYQERCGQQWKYVPTYGVSETSQDAHIALGKATAGKSGLGTSKNYQQQLRHRFIESQFTGLPNFKAIFLGCDGDKPIGPIEISLPRPV